MGLSQYDPAAQGRRAWNAGKKVGIDHLAHMSTRQYARLVDEWVEAIGLRSLLPENLLPFFLVGRLPMHAAVVEGVIRVIKIQQLG